MTKVLYFLFLLSKHVEFVAINKCNGSGRWGYTLPWKHYAFLTCRLCLIRLTLNIHDVHDVIAADSARVFHIFGERGFYCFRIKPSVPPFLTVVCQYVNLIIIYCESCIQFSPHY